MNKNKIYKMYRWIYTDKQIEDILNWKKIPTSWEEKEKEKKRLEKIKKDNKT